MTRFFHLDSLPLPPGRCFVCLRAEGAGFTDTGVHDEWMGAFYICDYCVMEMAAGLNWVSPVQVADMRTELGQLRIEVVKAQAQLEQLETVRKVMDDYARSSVDSGRSASSDSGGTRRRGGRRSAEQVDADSPG